MKFFRQRYNKSHSGIFHLRHSCECFACNVAITAPTGIAGEVCEALFFVSFEVSRGFLSMLLKLIHVFIGDIFLSLGLWLVF